MGFLAPLFLAGALAIAVPVLVHLTHREKREPVRFPSLMFLHRVPFRSRERQRIRHWWLFALRVLAVVLLAAAFARPVLKSRIAGAASSGHLAVVIDRSASMGAADRWTRATAAVREAVAAAPAGSRVGFYAAGDVVEVLQEPTQDHASVLAALQLRRPADGGANTPAALRVAAGRLAELGGGELVLVSDFQRAGFERAEPANLPQGVQLRSVDVGGAGFGNVGVTSVSIEVAPDADDRVVTTARLVATGLTGPRPVPVRLEVEGRLAAMETVTVRPGAGASVRFASLRRPEGPRAARVVLPADAYPADDTHHFVFATPTPLGVLVRSRADAPGGDGFFLRQALAVAESPRLTVGARPVTSVRTVDLDAARLAILRDAPFPQGTTGERLLAWVARGNGLLIALGQRGTLPREVSDSIGTPGPIYDRTTSAATLAPTDVHHPVFAMWGTPAREVLATARAWRYRRLDAPRGVLARGDDGAPALVEARLGRGRVLVWTGEFSNRWSDLPLQPPFVPLLLSAVRYLAAWEPQPPARVVGDVADLSALSNASGPLVAEQPGGARAPLNAAARLPLPAAGLWQVRRQGAREPILLLAANTPASESDPARVAPASVVTAGSETVAPAPATAALQDEEAGKRQRLWWFALVTVIVVVAAESLVASRLRGYA